MQFAVVFVLAIACFAAAESLPAGWGGGRWVAPIQPATQFTSRRGCETMTNFNAAGFWPNCSSIMSVKDQGACNSCYAVVPAAMFTDRWCIKYGFGTMRDESERDIMQCCNKYGYDCGTAVDHRCDWGTIDGTYQYMFNRGIVSEYCLGYGNYYSGSSAYTCATGQEYCDPSSRYYGKHYCGTMDNSATGSISAIKSRICTNGPVVAAVELYSNFVNEYWTGKTGFYTRYPNGIYRTDITSPADYPLFDGNGNPAIHYVKIYGWEYSSSGSYWLIANSVGTSHWGINGLGRILIGSNNMNIENAYVTTCIPTVP
jgi:cathepsin B